MSFQLEKHRGRAGEPLVWEPGMGFGGRPRALSSACRQAELLVSPPPRTPPCPSTFKKRSFSIDCQEKW